MERLTKLDRQTLKDFHAFIQSVCPEDFNFPPDAGVRQPAPGPLPTLPPAEEVCRPVAYLSERRRPGTRSTQQLGQASIFMFERKGPELALH